MQKIDFTKPLEIVGYSDNYEILQVIQHEYTNTSFKHAVLIKNGKYLFLEAVNSFGEFSSSSDFYQKFKLQNAKPKVTSETWVNLYNDGSTGDEYRSKVSADTQKNPYKKFHAYFVTKQYSDGTFTNEIIPISE